jgi:hypothetical protein
MSVKPIVGRATISNLAAGQAHQALHPQEPFRMELPKIQDEEARASTLKLVQR